MRSRKNWTTAVLLVGVLSAAPQAHAQTAGASGSQRTRRGTTPATPPQSPDASSASPDASDPIAPSRSAGTPELRLQPLVGTGPAPSQTPRLMWREDLHRRFSMAEGAFSAGMAGAALSGYLAPASTGPANWVGGILADDATRGGLMLSSPGARDVAATASDVLVGALVATPILVDALLTAWLVRGSSDVALQMLLMNFQAHAFAQGITSIIKLAVRRERPMATGCREDAARRVQDPHCQGSAEPEIADHSFFSGHTSLAFTSAALICMHHTELGLLGEAGDAAMCATGLALATGVGVLRMMSDRHYLSDVVIGAAVGLLSGWLIPDLLHFVVFGDEQTGINGTVTPMVDGDVFGLSVVGTF